MSAPGYHDLSGVFRVLGERTGIELESLGIKGVAHAVRKQMAAEGATSPQEFCRHLASDKSAMERLLEELLVPETWFFRDPTAFQCLARGLADRRWPYTGTIRVLSIACSTGEEVYSLAMTLRNAGLEPPQYSVLGVDLSHRAIEVARAGTYRARSFRESNDNGSVFCDRWCEHVDDAWQVRDDLRRGVEFRRANLSRPDFLAGEPAFQIILCRNVLIYFHAEARRTAVEHVWRLLAQNGLVLTAPAEARIFADGGFRSLGGECSFAFCRPGDGAVLSPKTVTAQCGQTVAAPPSRLTTRTTLSPSDTFQQPGAVRLLRPVDPCASPLATDAIASVDLPLQALLRAAREAADQGRLDEADAICDHILAEDIACVDAHHLRGVVQVVQGQLHEAQRSLEKALYLDPRHYDSLTHMMLLAERRGDSLAAANYRRRAEEVASGGTE